MNLYEFKATLGYRKVNQSKRESEPVPLIPALKRIYGAQSGLRQQSKVWRGTVQSEVQWITPFV